MLLSFSSDATAQTSRRLENNSVLQYHFGAADLGMSAVTLPASASTALSSKFSLSGANALAINMNCTQAATVVLTLYRIDGTTVFGTYNLATTVTAGANVVALSDFGVSASAGTAVAASPRLPQMQGAISFLNTTATPGTCTAELMIRYSATRSW